MEVYGGAYLPLTGGTMTGTLTGADGSTWNTTGINIASGKSITGVGITPIANTVVMLGLAAGDVSGTYGAVRQTGVGAASNLVIGFTDSTVSAFSTFDTGFSKISAGVIAAGNGTAGNTSGEFQAAVYKTTTALITSTGASTPAFGTNFVGGTGGPTTAAQNGWVKMKDSTGATIWVPVWK